MVIESENAIIRKGGNNFFLSFDNGLITGGIYLNNTIYSLLPCNLNEELQIDSLEVKVSGEVKDNPAFSSHTNYTDFYITEIIKAST